MSEQSKAVSLEEYVAKQKQAYHDAAIQCKTMAESVKDTKIVVNAYTFYSSVAGIYDEFESLYAVLDIMMREDKFAIGLSKSILGFNKPTHIDEIEARAKELGEFSSTLINKKKEWELEDKEKERFK